MPLAAYNEANRDKSGEAWQEVFGEKFPILEEDLESGGEVVKERPRCRLVPQRTPARCPTSRRTDPDREGYLNIQAWTYIARTARSGSTASRQASASLPDGQSSFVCGGVRGALNSASELRCMSFQLRHASCSVL